MSRRVETQQCGGAKLSIPPSGPLAENWLRGGVVSPAPSYSHFCCIQATTC